jgi:carboxynorspermidine decarboxylase
MDKTGCKILLAQKAFSLYSMYPLIAQYLSGTTASGLYEARLGHEEFGGETHVFSAAYTDDEITEIAAICDYVIFNSFSQFEKHKNKITNSKIGIRVNPEISTANTAKYDPCAPGARLGVTEAEFRADKLDGVSGLHFHTLCEQGSEDLVRTVAAFEGRFGKYLKGMEWVNFGGGHHITKDGYDIDLLIDCITRFRDKYDVEVYLEPGEAVVLDAGYFVCTVLDTVRNGGIEILVLDGSAACHAPDVLEMPYRPPVHGAGEAGTKKYTYRLGGPTCLAGDVFGDYSFDEPMGIGSKIIFTDMAHYSFVKNNTFNGMPLPDICVARDGKTEPVRRFGYGDFKGRL